MAMLVHEESIRICESPARCHVAPERVAITASLPAGPVSPCACQIPSNNLIAATIESCNNDCCCHLELGRVDKAEALTKSALADLNDTFLANMRLEMEVRAMR